jgi:hypothetical protein
MISRRDLDFGFDGDIPRFWFGGDPFKTRFFDAFSVAVPSGERWFIECMRDYRDATDDAELREQMRIFILQEGQHSLVHRQYNERLAKQGIDVASIDSRLSAVFGLVRRFASKRFCIAFTAAFEHMTTIASHGFFDSPEVYASADRRVMAMYLWHGAEEIEHKSVAFDVMQKAARAGYFTRIWAMMAATVVFAVAMTWVIDLMLRADGISLWQRFSIWIKGERWYYGSSGPFRPVMRHLFAYYAPRFHPWKRGRMDGYAKWREAFDKSGDALAAADAVR